jgi:acetoin utilization deacetylase AcuC-like enzyme
VLAYTHPACLTHDPGAAHPEQPERLRAVVEALRSAFGERLIWVEAPRATREQVLRAHTGRLVDELDLASPASGTHRVDADTVMSSGSLEASQRACGAACAAIDAVLAGPDRRAFCAVRPPGHHSSADQATGFCLYNQIAVGARHALAAHHLDSTVTLLARLRGWSTSVPLRTATW